MAQNGAHPRTIDYKERVFVYIPEGEGLLSRLSEVHATAVQRLDECRSLLNAARDAKASLTTDYTAPTREDAFMMVKHALKAEYERLCIAWLRLNAERLAVLKLLEKNIDNPQPLGLWEFIPTLERTIAQHNCIASWSLEDMIADWAFIVSRAGEYLVGSSYDQNFWSPRLRENNPR